MINENNTKDEAANRLRAKIEKWLDDVLNDVREGVSVHEHIDYVLSEALPQSSTIDVSLQAFAILLRCVVERRVPVVPGLHIRLRGLSSKITVVTPSDLQAIKEQWRFIEPPSLILQEQNFRNYLPYVEEYRCPLRFSLFTPSIAGVAAFYKESKSSPHEDEDEFDRSVNVEYAEHRPNRYVDWRGYTVL